MTIPVLKMSLYPTMDSLLEVIKYGESQAPLTTPNEIFSLLMTYHNTLLDQLAKEKVVPIRKDNEHTKLE